MKRKILWICLSTIPFFVFFLQYPLQYSLTGDLDTIANLAMYKELQYWLSSIFTSTNYTSFCYPVENVWLYVGADFGIGIIHIFYNLLGFNDLWANYLFISTLFSLNTYAFFLLLDKICKNATSAILASLIFSFSHFKLANLENPNTLVFFFSFLSILFLIEYIEEDKKVKKHLLFSILLSGVQIYFSPYNFLFHSVIFICFYIFYSRKHIFTITTLAIFIAHIIIISPYILAFIINPSISESYNVIGEGNFVQMLSLSLIDFFHVLPNHLYLQPQFDHEYKWIIKIKAAYLGILFYVLSFSGILFLKIKNKALYVTLIIIGLIFSFGPYLTYKLKVLFPSILYPLYEFLNFENILRIPLRAFFIAIIGFTIILSHVFSYLLKQQKSSIYILFALIILENVPYKMETYQHKKIILNETDYITKINDLEPKVTLNLPSSLFGYKEDRREYIYMYWHHQFKCNIVNGNLGFIPKERMHSYELTKESNALKTYQLSKEYQIDYIVFHKDLIYSLEEKKLFKNMLQLEDEFNLIFDSPNKSIFQIL